jgi:hypothetical protein
MSTRSGSRLCPTQAEHDRSQPAFPHLRLNRQFSREATALAYFPAEIEEQNREAQRFQMMRMVAGLRRVFRGPAMNMVRWRNLLLAIGDPPPEQIAYGNAFDVGFSDLTHSSLMLPPAPGVGAILSPRGEPGKTDPLPNNVPIGRLTVRPVAKAVDQASESAAGRYNIDEADLSLAICN